MILINDVDGHLVVNAIGDPIQLQTELSAATAQLLLKMTRDDKKDEENLRKQGEAWGEVVAAALIAMSTPTAKKHTHDFSMGAYREKSKGVN